MKKRLVAILGGAFLFALAVGFSFTLNSGALADTGCACNGDPPYTCCTGPNGLKGVIDNISPYHCSCVGGVNGCNPCSCPLVCPHGT